MLEKLLSGLKDQVSGPLTEQAGLSSDKIDDVVGLVGNVAGDNVKGEMLGGNLSTVMNLFSSKENSSEAGNLQSGIAGSAVEGLVSKLGFDQGKATMISGIVIPALMNMITKKNEETPEDDTSPITSLFGGGDAGGGIAGKALGGLGGIFGK